MPKREPHSQPDIDVIIVEFDNHLDAFERRFLERFQEHSDRQFAQLREHFTGQLGSLTREIHRMAGELQALNDKVDAQAAQIAGLQTSLDTEQQQIADAVAALQATNTDLQATIATLQAQLEGGATPAQLQAVTDKLTANSEAITAIQTDLEATIA